MKKEKLRRRIKIDKNTLVRDCANQPEDFLHFADKLPDLYEIKQDVKDELERVISKVSLKIRKNPEKYIKGKITDKAINDRAILDKKVIAAKKTLIKAEKDFKRAENRTKAFDQRRSMLKYIVGLFHDQYWTKDDISNEDELNTKFREEMKKKNKKKKRKKI